MKNALINTGEFSPGEYSGGKFSTVEFDGEEGGEFLVVKFYEGEFSAREFS